MKYLFLVLTILFAGCATKQFEDKNAKEVNLKSNSSEKSLEDYTKKALTFKELKLKYVKPTSFIDDGVKGEYVNYDLNGTELGKFKKLDKNLAVYADEIKVLKNNQNIKLPYLIYSATKKGNLIAVVFENNAYGIYDLSQNRLVFYKKSDDAITAKYLGEKPLFYNSLILFPLLNGTIAVVDANALKFVRNIDISDDFIIDNVIYLNIVNDNLLMATPKRLVLFNPNFLIDYKDSIKHVIDYDGYVYLFNNEGKVIKFDSNLKKIKEKEFPFASFFAPSVCKGNIYTLTSSGYLIKLTPELNATVYKTDQFDTDFPLKIKGCKIYNQDKVFFIE